MKCNKKIYCVSFLVFFFVSRFFRCWTQKWFYYYGDVWLTFSQVYFQQLSTSRNHWSISLVCKFPFKEIYSFFFVFFCSFSSLVNDKTRPGKTKKKWKSKNAIIPNFLVWVIENNTNSFGQIAWKFRWIFYKKEKLKNQNKTFCFNWLMERWFDHLILI